MILRKDMNSSMTCLKSVKTRRTMSMNNEGMFKTLTKEKIIRFLDMKSIKELRTEKILRFLKERAVED